MASEKVMNVDAFFRIVSSGSVDELKKMIVDCSEETTKIANSFNDEGETPLIVAIKGNHPEMVRFLVRELKADICQLGRFTWKNLDYLESPPLFAAIMCDNRPDMITIKFLIYQTTEPSTIFYSISSSDFLTRNQKIDVLELVGAAYCLIKLSHLNSLKFAARFWSEALSLRRGDSSRSPVPKIPLQLSECARKVFGNVSEFTTDEVIDEICESTLDEFRLIRSEYHLQALLMIQRIMSQIHPDPHRFFLNHLFVYGERLFIKEAQYSQAMDVVFLALEAFPALPLEDATLYELFSIVFERAIFSTLECAQRSPNKLPFTTVTEVLHRFSDFHCKLLKFSTIVIPEGPLVAAMALLFQLIANILPLNQKESLELKQWLFQYMLAVNRHSGVPGPLHSVCLNKNLLNRFQIIQLLLEAGANPMAADHHGNSPLHYLPLLYNFDINDARAAVELLLNFGAHLDQSNPEDITPLKMFKAIKLLAEEDGRPDPYLHSLCNTILPLQCYCAQAVRQNGITFKEDELSSNLKTFLREHMIKFR